MPVRGEVLRGERRLRRAVPATGPVGVRALTDPRQRRPISDVDLHKFHTGLGDRLHPAVAFGLEDAPQKNGVELFGMLTTALGRIEQDDGRWVSPSPPVIVFGPGPQTAEFFFF